MRPRSSRPEGPAAVVMAAAALSPEGASVARAQGVRHIPAHARGVPWAGTPAGVAAQVGVAALATAGVIYAAARLRPGPCRRGGRRSSLVDAEAPLPPSDAPGPGAVP